MVQTRLVKIKTWRNLNLHLLSFLLLFPMLSLADTMADAGFRFPFYVGASYGYGATTWQGLVPTEENQNLALEMSTPIKVQEGGQAWGAFIGYEFMPTFAIEANYLRYSNATIFFEDTSLFSFNNDSRTQFISHTESVNLMAKVMLLVPNTKVRLYSSAGAASVHRSDLLISQWRLSPTFGFGLNYRVARHLMAELNGNYTAGFGESQLEPSSTFFPFLYSVSIRLAYIF